MPRKRSHSDKPSETNKKKPSQYRVEDAHLWDIVAKEVTPLAPDSTVVPQTHDETIPTPNHSQRVSVSVEERLSSMPKPAALLKPSYALSTGDARDVNRTMAKQIKTGKYPVDIKLDLHGKNQVQAHEALVQAVTKAYHSGKRCLLVITGKGKFTQGGGILRRQLPQWLNQENIRAYVLMVNEATPSDGGSGAFYVMIRRKR